MMFVWLIFGSGIASFAAVAPLIIDHRHIDINQLTQLEIERAKSVLHIGYGHTSHGSQITDDMSGLVGFANWGGLGISLPIDIFEWNNGGTDGALDLHDYAMGGDVGYYPAWYNNTVAYLDNPANADVNVIMWSWCGQMDDKYNAGTLTNEYFAPMAALEAAYSNVVFVYMTGHVDIWNDANNKAACAVIRQWCIDNNKVLFDFNDIEHYNPDGTFFEFVNDDCSYYSYAGGSAQGNWATEWQATHTEDVDWYDCDSAHSEPLNANMKAYAVWKLWCELAEDLDRDGFRDEWEERFGGTSLFGNPEAHSDADVFTDWQEFIADTNPTNSDDYLCINSVSKNSPLTVYFESSSNRIYSLLWSTNMVDGVWTDVPGSLHMGAGGADSITVNRTAPAEFYKLEAELP